MRPEFEGFGKIPRLNRDIVVTEKIDGTNAGIYVDDDNKVYACSRKRWITPEEDNYGFARWVKEHESELVGLGLGMHWGEWWGQGIQRKYGLDHKRFSLFATHRWTEDLILIAGIAPVGVPLQPPECCHVVPILWRGNFKNFNSSEAMSKLVYTGSHAAPGFMKPEGIMIFHEASRSYFKATILNDAKPKGSDSNA